ncbi:phage minor head protein [Saccharopolyspora sp. NPDC002376]
MAIVVAKLVLEQASDSTVPLGAASRQMQRTNLLRRAQFLLAAARRVTRQIGTGRSREALVEALRREQRFWRQHRQASVKRTQAAAVADSAADQHGVPTKTGTVLGWSSQMDDRTTAECRAAHGKNWIVERPPRIGIPGTVHVHCRCRPVAPWPTKQLVGGGQLPETPRR